MNDRSLIQLSGEDSRDFLQGLITNDVTKTSDGLVYAALLTPQGKFIADFFVLEDGDALVLDVASSHAANLAQRLAMYRLRAKVDIAESFNVVSRGTGPAPDGAFADPRDSNMGWRAYETKDISDETDWDALRVAHVIPETGIELTPDTYILEAGFERLNGIDFRKGCYVGQEIAARMKHKTELKKGLVQVEIEGHAPVGTEITADGKSVGTLYTQSGNHALAHLRFGRATEEMQAGTATLRLP
ncbi:folate-binding protein [Octadecabacter sp. 1_MG-2023]|uniref:CAF17-like 4Fe-4S cluster assembly/insertion protein YgfZ n=1 Tax=unclassified Octadecabacter TaxID=196158 RepID=UPI001C09C7EB|nr:MULTISPECIES: folate-binding protein [unclassified Octadecabacter]MBU2992657.1 folate-binding protein [Octadecabacter sp. B2R22]MDO6733892.1 folate-binding protein [Octadecabacter sp. 1_MG-2023]